jgi:hypothetical protein
MGPRRAAPARPNLGVSRRFKLDENPMFSCRRTTRQYTSHATLVGRGLAAVQDADQQSRRFVVTDAGRQALGDAAPVAPVEAVSAALARDVVERHERLRRHWVTASAPASNWANCAGVFSLGGRSRILLSTLA